MNTCINSSYEHTFKNEASPKSALLDLAFVLGTLFVLKTTLLQIPVMWTYAGPISLLSALAVASWRLKVAGQSWKQIGFINDQSKLSLVLWTLAAFVLTTLIGNIAGSLFEQVLTNPDTVSSEIQQTMSGRFANLSGNIVLYIYWLIIAWVIGGFTEELLFRGFMIQRFNNLYQKLPFAIGLAVLTQALIFGQQHYYYQGLAGFAATGVIGLISGTLYVFTKRRLWPLILSHGLANTLGITMMFLNVGG